MHGGMSGRPFVKLFEAVYVIAKGDTRSGAFDFLADMFQHLLEFGRICGQHQVESFVHVALC